MKKKIFGIFVCTLLLVATILPVTGNLYNESLKEKLVINGDSKTDDIDTLNIQSSNEVFNKKLEESFDRAYRDWIAKAQQTTDGGYIAIGVVESYGAGSRDAWLIKTDSNGNEDWNKTWGREYCDGAIGGQQTSDGGYVLAGWGRWSPSWDTDFWLIKTYSNGNEHWNKRYGSTGDDTGYFVQQTSDGGYIFTGITKSYSAGDWDVWLVKTDSNGDEEWNNSFGGSLTDGGFVVRQVDDGYIITGWTDSYGAGMHDVWLIKTNTMGDEVWDKTFGGAAKDSGHDVQQTSDGGYIIIGYTSSYGDLDRDIWLIKTDSNGNEEWNKTFEGADAYTYLEGLGWSSGMSVRQTNDGGLIILGITDIDYEDSLLDIFLVKINANGEEVWNKTFGGTSYDEGYWINETSDGGYIISGATMSYGTPTVDGWLIKTDSNGDEEWNKTFGGQAPGNNPPNEPYPPEGPDEGIIGLEYMFNTSTEDADGDDVYYKFDWGDGTDSGWVGPYPSGDIGSASHIWDDEGDYYIKAIAMDENGDTSDWSYTSKINITEENEPPYKPKITGPNSGKIGEKYEFKLSAKDPQDHDIYFKIEWGDGEIEDWIGPYKSDEEIILNHTWDEKNTYTIKAKAKDIYDAESQEATLRVTIPKNKIFIFNFPLLNWLFERFPNAFPIIRYIVELT